MSFLTERFQALCRQHPGTLGRGVLRDHLGVYAMDVRTSKKVDAYFCAKRSVGGNQIVSVHQTLWEKARQEKRPIIMAVGDVFYWFNPLTVTPQMVNVYREIPMVNFTIDQGHQILAPDKSPTLFT